MRSTARLLIVGFSLLALAELATARFDVGESDDQGKHAHEVLVEGQMPSDGSVASKLSVPLKDVPASVGVVTRQRIEQQSSITVGDALENLSGVAVHTGSGVFDFFVVRGMDSLSSGLVMVDGSGEPESTFYQLYNVQRVELLKGPSSFLYGGIGIGSAVDLVRKQPELRNTGSIFGEVGSFGSYRTNLDVNLASDQHPLAFRLNALWQESDGYRDDKFSRVRGVNPAVSWGTPEGHQFVLNTEYIESQYHPDAGIPIVSGRIADVPRKQSYESPFDSSDQEIYRLRFNWSHQLNDSVLLRNKTYLTRMDWLSAGTLLGQTFSFSPELPPVVTRTFIDLDDRQTFMGNQFEAVIKLGDTHELLAGLELARLEDRFNLDIQLLPPIALSNPVETASQPLMPIAPSQTADVRSYVLAPYVLDRIRFNEQLSVWLGARLDTIDFKDETSGRESDTTELSPMAGVLYTATPSLKLYLNAGRGFAPPSSRVLEARDPEESRQVEFGIRPSFGDRVSTNFAVYHIERRDIAIPDDNGVTQQTGSLRSRGAEIELESELSEGLFALLSYAYNETELTEFTETVFSLTATGVTATTLDRKGNSAAFAPKHLGRLWLTKQLDFIELSGGLRYVAEQFIAEDNAFKLDDYVLGDVAVSATHGPWRGAVNFDNITDTEYETRGFGATSVIPAPGIGIRGSLSYRY